MYKILLDNNYGFAWNSDTNLYYKGYIFYKNNLMTLASLNDVLSTINSIKEFETIIKTFKGIFSIIYVKDNFVFAAVDQTRTFPLFYSTSENTKVISDNTYNEIFNNKGKNLNTCNQLLGMRYVLGNKTLINGVNQIQAGECILLNDSMKTKTYSQFSVDVNEVINVSSSLSSQFKKILFEATERLIESVSGRTLIIPLSGGYDSRLVLSLLYKHNYENVICYTYGNKNNDEVKISEKVAKKLGYKWFLLETDEIKIPDDYLNSKEFTDYVKLSFNNISLIPLQDYFFVRKMKADKLIPDDSIFLPGHSGDFLVGNHLFKFDKKNYNFKAFSKQIIKRHFVLKSYKTDLHINNILKKYYNSKSLSYSLIDNFNFKERQAKFIVNSVRIYEYFGHEHRMLLWDQELTSFFKTLPFDLRYKSKFYKKEIFRLFFNELGIDFIPESKKDSKKDFVKMVKPYVPQNVINKIRNKRKVVDEKFKGVPYKKILNQMNSELNTNISNRGELVAKWLVERF